MLRMVAASASSVCVVSSWKLESSSTHTSGSVPASTHSVSLSSAEGLMLPATPTVLPARWTRAPASAVVVVLPLVPVMARTRGA